MNKVAGESSEFLTPIEVAQTLRLNVMTVYKYIRQGNLGAIRIGRSYRISHHDLTAFIRSRQVGKVIGKSQ